MPVQPLVDGFNYGLEPLVNRSYLNYDPFPVSDLMMEVDSRRGISEAAYARECALYKAKFLEMKRGALIPWEPTFHIAFASEESYILLTLAHQFWGVQLVHYMEFRGPTSDPWLSPSLIPEAISYTTPTFR